MRLNPHSFAFTALIGALAALPPLSIDMGLPALGVLQSDLGATAAEASGTLSLFLYGFAAGQLAMGPLSDRFGRRPVLLVGLAIYAMFGMACALAWSPGWLLVFRLIEGVGAAGGSTLAMAIVRDLFSGQAGRIKMSAVSMVIVIAPIIAPSIGATLLVFGEWRFIYVTLGLSGVALFVAAYFWLDETRPADPGARIDVVGRYAAVFRSKRTLGYALVNAAGAGALFSFIGTSSLVLMGQMGLSASGFAMIFAMTSGGILLGSTLNNLFARRAVAASIPLTAGLVIAPVAALAATGFLWVDIVSPITLVPFVILVGMSRGMINANATHAALEPVPHHAGAASALLGFMQIGSSATAGVLVAFAFPRYGALAVTVAMAIYSLLAVVAWRWVETRHPAEKGL
ncbi:MAG: multidrug effflux MFS transporter [Acetobacteraceae bacterium]|nr:multidrug effflux MFS transporter [Acetobacteraceae bacterium]